MSQFELMTEERRRPGHRPNPPRCFFCSLQQQQAVSQCVDVPHWITTRCKQRRREEKFSLTRPPAPHPLPVSPAGWHAGEGSDASLPLNWLMSKNKRLQCVLVCVFSQNMSINWIESIYRPVCLSVLPINIYVYICIDRYRHIDKKYKKNPKNEIEIDRNLVGRFPPNIPCFTKDFCA